MPGLAEKTEPFLFRVLDEQGRLITRPPNLSTQKLIELYGMMVRLRLLDERMMNLQRQGRIGFYGACTGQEGAVVGSGSALAPEDWIFPALREGGILLMRGLPLSKYISMVFGNSEDPSKGRQMPCHYFDKKLNQVSWSSCIGTQIPHAVGAAWAIKYLKHKNITIAYMGDGATSEGDFHTAMNFAGVFNTPTIFFCQNNQWSISVPSHRQTKSESIAVKAKAYGFPGVRVDGNDLLAVYQVTTEAVERARNGKGPTLIEALTYRIGSHSSSDDPRIYRDDKEVELWSKRDPITRMQRYLESEKFWNEEEELILKTGIQEEITKAIQEAATISPPPLDTLFEDLFKNKPWHILEQEQESKGLE